MNICIAVVAFNKVEPLKRLLTSISKISLTEGSSVDLCFCIDGGGPPSVTSLCQAFDWHGANKKIINRSENLGLKKNVYETMKLGLEYDLLIVLEDDLYVSSQLVSYVEQVYSHYQSSDYLAGFSLYAANFNETAYCNFQPINDGNSTYFMKVPSSWGQFYSKKQISEYFAWLESNNIQLSNLPPNVARWSAKSWKKEFFAYLIETNKYFCYPTQSLTTNFADAGQHHRGSDIYQVPLVSKLSHLELIQIEHSNAVYDEYYEIEPRCLNRHNKKLQTVNYTTNIYGFKERNNLKNKYQHVLSTVDNGNAVMSWDNALIPLENNIINDVQGKGLFLYKMPDAKFSRFQIIKSRIQNFLKLHQIRIDGSLISRFLGRS